MSMHKIPLTPIEESGLRAHGLDIGKPSQLSDAFRQGVRYASAQLPGQGGEAVAWAICKEPGRVDWLSATYANKRAAAAHVASYKDGLTLYITPLYAAPVSEAKAHGVVQWPEADEIMQMAFEEGQPADDASGYCFELEEFDLFIERLMSEVARLNAAHAQQVSVPDERIIPTSAELIQWAWEEEPEETRFQEGYNAAKRWVKMQIEAGIAAPAAPAADAWIPVGERLPEPGEPVQVWCEGAEQPGLAWVSRHADWSGEWVIPEPQAIGYESITHWMPLPSGPAAHRAKGVM